LQPFYVHAKPIGTPKAWSVQRVTENLGKAGSLWDLVTVLKC